MCRQCSSCPARPREPWSRSQKAGIRLRAVQTLQAKDAAGKKKPISAFFRPAGSLIHRSTRLHCLCHSAVLLPHTSVFTDLGAPSASSRVVLVIDGGFLCLSFFLSLSLILISLPACSVCRCSSSSSSPHAPAHSTDTSDWLCGQNAGEQ